jgi:hypothetical protein
MREFKLLINGKLVPGVKRLDVINPATEELLAEATAAARRSTSCSRPSPIPRRRKVFPQGIGAASYGEPAHHHRGQERGLSESHGGDEEGRRALAPITAAAESKRNRHQSSLE